LWRKRKGRRSRKNVEMESEDVDKDVTFSSFVVAEP
jgi:hypothetical protein